MNDFYYIALTIVFALFVLFIMWWLYTSLRKRSFGSMTNLNDLTAEDRRKLSQFCSEMKRLREQSEKRKVLEQEKQDSGQD